MESIVFIRTVTFTEWLAVPAVLIRDADDAFCEAVLAPCTAATAQRVLLTHSATTNAVSELQQSTGKVVEAIQRKEGGKPGKPQEI